MRASAALPILLLAGGAALIGLALANGGAAVAIVVVLPVLYGRSLEFIAGVLLLVAGIFALPLLVASGAPPPDAEDDERLTVPGGTGTSGGGLVLIGPVPIFFGGWTRVSARTRWIVAAIGAVALAAAIALIVLA